LHGERERMDMAAWLRAEQLTKPHWISSERLRGIMLPEDRAQWPQPIPGWPGWYIGAWPSGSVPLPPDMEIDKGPAWRR
jgi:hypothetical protein